MENSIIPFPVLATSNDEFLGSRTIEETKYQDWVWVILVRIGFESCITIRKTYRKRCKTKLIRVQSLLPPRPNLGVKEELKILSFRIGFESYLTN